MPSVGDLGNGWVTGQRLQHPNLGRTPPLAPPLCFRLSRLLLFRQLFDHLLQPAREQPYLTFPILLFILLFRQLLDHLLQPAREQP